MGRSRPTRNNEDFQNGNYGAAGLLRIVEPIKARGGLVASSCPAGMHRGQTGDPFLLTWILRPLLPRAGAGDRSRPTRAGVHRRADPPPDTPRPAWDGEPIGPNQDAGPGVTINHTEDVEADRAPFITLFGRRAGATYMSQHGVFWNGRIHEQPGFSVTRMRAALRTGPRRDALEPVSRGTP